MISLLVTASTLAIKEGMTHPVWVGVVGMTMASISAPEAVNIIDDDFDLTTVAAAIATMIGSLAALFGAIAAIINAMAHYKHGKKD